MKLSKLGINLKKTAGKKLQAIEYIQDKWELNKTSKRK